MRTYQPSMCQRPGVYIIEVGDCFYVGSSGRLGIRISDHRCRLHKGEHFNHRLQSEWDRTRSFRALIVFDLTKLEHETPKGHKRRLRLHEEAVILANIEDPACCNKSESASYFSGVGAVTRERWKDPAFRGLMIERLKGRSISNETKEKMAEAKRGAKNIKARRCSLELRGEKLEFETATAAAKHYGASQQTMDLWLRGVVPWPGKGPRKPKKTSAHLIGLSGSYLS